MTVSHVVLECGAHNGTAQRLHCHNLLRHHGWKGVLLEPHPERFAQLQKNRHKHLCLNYALAGHNGVCKYRPHRKLEALTARCMTWDALVVKYDLHIDYAIIDVEHMELDVLSCMTLRLPPKLRIEMHMPVHDTLIAKGYKRVRALGVDCVYHLADDRST